MSNDLVDVLEGATPEWSDQATVNVVLAAKGYPTGPETGATIKGLQNVPEVVLVFHAGTRRDGKKLVVDGGRVLNLVGAGPDVETARERAYEAVASISWPGAQFRTDIAQS
jgi:phosphoribosylamine--glycine ligase